MPFNRHCPVTFFFPSLFRSSSIASSVLNFVNIFFCSWILECVSLWSNVQNLGLHSTQTRSSSDQTDVLFHWLETKTVAPGTSVSQLCTAKSPGRTNADQISHGCKKSTKHINQKPQSELIESQHIALSSGSNCDLILGTLKWNFYNTELRSRYFQRGQKTGFFCPSSSRFRVICNIRR